MLGFVFTERSLLISGKCGIAEGLWGTLRLGALGMKSYNFSERNLAWALGLRFHMLYKSVRKEKHKSLSLFIGVKKSEHLCSLHRLDVSWTGDQARKQDRQSQ